MLVSTLAGKYTIRKKRVWLFDQPGTEDVLKLDSYAFLKICRYPASSGAKKVILPNPTAKSMCAREITQRKGLRRGSKKSF